jgi:cysteine synthase
VKKKKMIKKGFCELVGSTPLVELSAGKEHGVRVLAKAEWMSAGGSVKDRAAKYIVEEAEQSRRRPFNTIVEGTAGNTGIGLAHVALSKGYRCIIYMPETQSTEKKEALVQLGVELHCVPAVPYSNPDMYQHQARRAAEAMGHDALWGNQFDNLANRYAHYASTADEIWRQTDGGQFSAFTCATGTAGTLSGVAQYIKERDEERPVFLADPPGSVLYRYFECNGALEREGDGSITEGIGNGRLTANLVAAIGQGHVDGALHIPDELMIATMFRVLADDGLFVGPSSALNIAAAIELGRRLDEPEPTVVTLIADSGSRYASKVLSRSFLESKELLQHVDSKYHRFLVD